MDRLTFIRLSDVKLRNFRLKDGAQLTRWCSRCRCDQQMELPGHPAGLGRCKACGMVLDLCDYPPEEKREYLDLYDEIPAEAGGA